MEPDFPEEALRDQLETATPVQFLDEDVPWKEGDPSTEDIHKETSDDVPTDLREFKTQVQDDATAAATHIPMFSFISTTLSEVVIPGDTSIYEDMKASTPWEGSAEGALPTPSASLSGVMTDETEVGGTEPSTFIPVVSLQDTTTQGQMGDVEGSASGDVEASGQDVYQPDKAKITTKLLPHHSLAHTHRPPYAVGTKITGEAVVGHNADGVAETGSSAEQLIKEEEDSGVQGGWVDLPVEISSTVLPTLKGQITSKIQDSTPEISKLEPFTQHSITGTDQKKLSDVAAKLSSPSSDHHSEFSHTSSATQSKLPSIIATHSVDLTTPSSSSLFYTFDHNSQSVPQWALSPDPSASALQEEGFVDYDRINKPGLLESLPESPVESGTTEQPEDGTDLVSSMEAVDVRGTRTWLIWV